MGKLFTPEDIVAGFQSTNSLNNNFAAIETATDACLSRTGGTPNAMEADLDMNSNDILNAGSVYVDEFFIDGEQIPSLEDIQEAFAAWDDNTDAVLAAATAAKDAAETAQTNAETAETGAEAARDQAEIYKDQAEAAAATAYVTPTGALLNFAGIAAPSGWLVRNGETFGPVGSGADNESADYEDLYTLIWDNFSDTVCPVSGGRGASAAADWTALKPIGIMDDRGLVERGFDDSGLVDVDRAGSGFGEYQADAFQDHGHGGEDSAFAAHTYGGENFLRSNTGTPAPSSPQLIETDGGTPRASTETRMKNRAYTPIIKV